MLSSSAAEQFAAPFKIVALLWALQSAAAANSQVPPAAPDASIGGTSGPGDAAAWWTGPILASSPDTLPRGRVLLEPYLFDVRSAGSDYAGSSTYILYGLTNRLTAGLIPTFGAVRSKANGKREAFAINDLTLTAHYRLHRAKVGAILPTLAFAVQRVLPLGRYEQLGGKLERGIGGGSAALLVGIYAQRVDRLASGRDLRTRLNVTHSFASRTRVRDESIFATPTGFRGTARVGAVAAADLSFEYSLTQRWALAVDFNIRHSRTVTADGSVADADGAFHFSAAVPARTVLGIAPAVEYSWAADRGILVGFRLSRGANGAADTFTPVIAFNAVL